MFERIRNWIRKGGAKLGMINSLTSIIDHPRINMPAEEYARIRENKRIYQQKFPNVLYYNSDNKPMSRPFRSINTSKVVARKLAKLVYNSGCKISVDGDGKNRFLQKVFSDNKFRKNFVEELEAGYAIGGLALRPYYDAKQNTIKISYCRSDSFFPLESNTNDVSEAAISTTTQTVEGGKNVYYTLLEFHEWEGGTYVIKNELYRSEDSTKVGVQVPLTALDKYADLQPRSELENFTRPLFVYIKLAGKNNADLSSPLGAGVIDNAKQQFVDINEKYDEFMWEIKKSATKIAASDHFFRVRYDKDGSPIRRFSDDTDVYQQLKTDELTYNTFSPSLRSAEFIESINFILRVMEMETGFSAGTFSFDGQSVKTATEVISENSETYSTRSDNVLIVEEAMKELVITIFELAQASGLNPGLVQAEEISVDFDDGVFESKEAQMEYNTKAVNGSLMPRMEAMKRQFNLTDDEALKWMGLIATEQTMLDITEVQEFIEQRTAGVGE